MTIVHATTRFAEEYPFTTSKRYRPDQLRRGYNHGKKCPLCGAIIHNQSLACMRHREKWKRKRARERASIVCGMCNGDRETVIAEVVGENDRGATWEVLI